MFMVVTVRVRYRSASLKADATYSTPFQTVLKQNNHHGINCFEHRGTTREGRGTQRTLIAVGGAFGS